MQGIYIPNLIETMMEGLMRIVVDGEDVGLSKPKGQAPAGYDDAKNWEECTLPTSPGRKKGPREFRRLKPRIGLKVGEWELIEFSPETVVVKPKDARTRLAALGNIPWHVMRAGRYQLGLSEAVIAAARSRSASRGPAVMQGGANTGRQSKISKRTARLVDSDDDVGED
jgi:hypothetical protein